MRVLHLPVNYGSISSHTVRALRQKGIDASGLIRTSSGIHSPVGLRVITLGSKVPLAQLLLSAPTWLYYFVKLVRWADVLHWYFGAPALPMGPDLAIVKYLQKPGLVEWQGSDIRIPEVEFAENPYYTTAFHNGYEYRKNESLKQSRQRQKRFREVGFSCVAPVGMLQYIQKDIFPHVHVLPQRLMLSDYQPIFPRTDAARPVVAHAPSAPIAKGTDAVLHVVDRLKTKCDFQFRLIQGLPWNQAIRLMGNADIVLDQFVLGDFGMASLEAMALGKPVLCYVKPSLAAKYPQDLPIVTATQDSLGDVLEQLIRDGKLRHELGQRGRAYVEKHHDALQIADRLKDIYFDLLHSQNRADHVRHFRHPRL